ncbi:MAG: membrane protein insertase YidC [Corynebacterium sp.]|nr:membrane protein insertase YidC [Corynebacterium sp.]
MSVILIVSAVLKLWHVFLHQGLGMQENLAWILSLGGFIITVRSLVAPLTWSVYRMARKTALLRPRLQALKDQYRTRTSAEEQKELAEKTASVMREGDVNPLGGCLPMLIQVPVIFGLYRVIIRIVRPTEGIAPVGFLTTADVNSFLQTRLWGQPFAAYASMPADQLAALGTTQQEVADFIRPIVIAATVFMTVNMLVSTARSVQTMDWTQKASVNSLVMMVVFAVYTPIMILTIAFTGPIPIALIFYWFINNFWTLGQVVIFWLLLEARYPLDDQFCAHRRASWQEFSAPYRLMARGRFGEGRAVLMQRRYLKREDKQLKREKRRARKTSVQME